MTGESALTFGELDALYSHQSELMPLVVSEGFRLEGERASDSWEDAAMRPCILVKLKQEHISRNIHSSPSTFLVFVCFYVSMQRLLWLCCVTEFTHSRVYLRNFFNTLYKLLKMKEKITLKLIIANI